MALPSPGRAGTLKALKRVPAINLTVKDDSTDNDDRWERFAVYPMSLKLA
jgi:hypothetical protein